MKAIVCDLCSLQDDYEKVWVEWTSVQSRLFLAEKTESAYSRAERHICPNCWRQIDSYLFSLVNKPTI
jgi:hypothetical protein